MNRKQKKQVTKAKQLTSVVHTRLEFTSTGARGVFVAGTFNEWQLRMYSLKSNGDGKWNIELALAPGRYEYRFIVDGEWTEDPGAQESVPNPYGGRNSVLVVSPPSPG